LDDAANDVREKIARVVDTCPKMLQHHNIEAISWIHYNGMDLGYWIKKMDRFGAWRF
jgi:hypothetical protein